MDFALTKRSNSGLVYQFWEQWTEHEDMLYRCCLRLMNSNRTDAEDALSRAALKAWEKVQKFEGKITNFKAWSIKLTHNLCIDMIRERSRGAMGVESIELVGDTHILSIASSVESPESFLEREERSIKIRRAIADLPETLRETFILHLYEELTHTEIAERQGISYNNVCRRIYVAKKKLKEKLSDYFLGTGEKVSVTAGYGRKLSTQRKYEEKQQIIESEERKEWETGTKELECDRAIFDRYSISISLHHPIAPITLSPHHPITSLPHHLITPSQEVEKSEFMDSSVELGDNVGQTIQEVATVSVEVGGDRVVEGEKQEYVESIVESREQVEQKIQETATELAEVESDRVVEAEKDGCVESSVGSKDNRDIQKINNFIQPFYRTASKGEQKSFFLYHPRSEKIASLLSVACCLSTASKSYQKKSFSCCLSREEMRWLRPYVMWGSLTGDNTHSELISRLMGEVKLFPNVESSLEDIQWMWDRSLMDTGG
ncbi:RNA polymerase sigma factor [Okeania sp. SIO2B3]|uniref:RNA polymerase sigma factor n=1 Tax=Okeania sp. SIO2B3 TaxID=2607784 RepID=UPI0013C19D7E|nr:sigma-70 family RNA polymerase sigma factor [Okeania sp. SIO2B3]NET42484.1 sigma-70 family RNA polymerase sigma factor [Okeania sp. SIO2B3]